MNIEGLRHLPTVDEGSNDPSYSEIAYVIYQDGRKEMTSLLFVRGLVPSSHWSSFQGEPAIDAFGEHYLRERLFGGKFTKTRRDVLIPVKLIRDYRPMSTHSLAEKCQ